MRCAASLLILLALASRAHAATPLLVWHTQDGEQARFFARMMNEFAAANDATLRLETGMDLHESLLLAAEEGRLPDVVFAPSDLVGFQAKLKLSAVPPPLAASLKLPKRAWETVTLDGKRYGVPLLEGNHLLLLYNKKLAKTPAKSFAEIEALAPAYKAKAQAPLAVEYRNAYVFLSFLASHGGWFFKDGKTTLNTPEMIAALGFFKSLGDKGLVLKACAYDCVTKRFYAGEAAYAINGDWAVQDARAALGADLGIAPLPQIGGKPMTGVRASHALVFPGGALGGKKSALLTKLAAFLASGKVQARWASEAGRLPVIASASGEGDDARVLREALERTRPMPTEPQLQTVWVVVQKGLSLLLDGNQAPEQVAVTMQSLATSAK